MVEVTDPADPAPVARIPDDSVNVTLRDASAVDTFMMDGGTYAMVATADGIVVVDLADPADHVPVGVTQNDPALRGASAVKTFHTAGHVYAAVAVPEGGGAIRIVSLGELDTVPPALSSAAWMPANRTIVMVFSEPLDHNATIYPEITILGESANLTLADISLRTAAGGAIAANLSLAQEAALGVPGTVQLSEGAVRDVSGNPIPPTSLAVTLDDFVPPALSSAAWMPANRTVIMVFSEPLDHNATIYPEITILGESANLTLADISSRTAAGGAIEANLSLAQEAALGVPGTVQLSEGAVRDVSGNPIPPTSLAVTLDDFVPPAVSSATYEPGTGLLTVSFSEPINHTATTYQDIAVAGPVRGDAMRISVLLAFIHPDIITVADPVRLYTLDEISIGIVSGTTIEAALDAAQMEAVGSAPMLYMVEGAVRDIWDSPVGLVPGLAVTVLDHDDSPVLTSSSYNTGTGILNIIFSEPLNGTAIHYDRMAVRDAGQSSGGLALDSVASRTLDADSTMMTLTLSTAQRQMVNAMAAPQLDITAVAVADTAGNGILAAPDQGITVADGIPPTISSAAYNPGTGILRITFSEPLNGTAIHYDRMAVRDAGQSSGGLALDSVASRTLDADSTMMTLTLSTAQRQMVNAMAAPQLDITAVAVADTAGNGILAAPDQGITVADGIPPTISSAAYNPGTGILRITFSEPLGPAVDYSGMVLAGESGNVALDDVSARDHSADTITVTLGAAQRTSVGGTMTLSVSEGAVTDIAGNGIARATATVVVTDGTPPALTSSFYNTGTGILRITFSEPLDPTVHYDRITVRDAGQSSGGLSLDDVTARAVYPSSATMILALSAAQRTAVSDMTTPQLDIGAGAIADTAGNDILAAPDRSITITDGIPPAISSATYNTGTGILRITFSEPLDPTVHYDRITVRDAGQSSGGLSLDDVTARAVYPSSATMILALSAAQRTAVSDMTTPQLDIGAGAIADTAGNDILAAPDRSITITDGIPPAISSATYNTGTGILRITFSEPLGPAVDYSGVSVVGPAGRVALDDVASKSHSGRTITATLDAAQRSTAGNSPTLSVAGGAVVDVSGNPVSPASNLQITIETPPILIIPPDPPSDSPPAQDPAPPANTAPSADAGAPRTVTEGATVSLDGTLSSDPEDTSLSYSWAHTSGPAVTLTGSATATPSFTAPNVGQTQNIVFALTVTDSGSLTDTDTVTITVNDSPNTPPTADAGDPQTVTEGATVTLSGTASDVDPEDSPTYAWTFNNTALGITLSSPSAPVTSFDAPNVAADTPVLFTLTVSDGTASSTDTVLVTIRDSANRPPTVDAGSNRTVTEGDTVSLSGTASDTDPEDTLAYQWTHNSSLAITLADAAALETTFTAPAVSANTTVLFTLNVTDGTVHVADTVTITIADRPNRAPTANAGANQTVTEGAAVSLNGTLSSDPEDGDSLSYSWAHTSGPTVTLTGSATATPSFEAPNVGQTRISCSRLP